MKLADESQARRGIVNRLKTMVGTRSTRRQRRQLTLERLEPRALLTTITEFPTSSSTVQPAAITTGSDGNLWFVEQGANAIGRMNPITHAIDTFSNGLPADAGLSQITSGPNGDLWFTENGLFANAIGMIDPNNTGQGIQNFGTTAGMTAKSSPTGIASVGSDIWFTQPLPAATPQIGKLDTSTGRITEFSAPSAMSQLTSQIVLGPDGNLYFTEFGAIGIFSPVTDSLVKEVPLPGGSKEQPLSIAVGPDGNIWYGAGNLNAAGSAFDSNVVGIVSTTSQSVIKEIALPASTEPFSLTAGPDGQMWVAVTRTSTVAGSIVQIDPATQTVTQTIPVPTNIVAIPNPIAITAGADGNVWFSDFGGAIGAVNLNVQPHFVVTSVPSTVTAGAGFGLTVTAEYGSGIVDSLYHGNVTVTTGSVVGPVHGANLTVTAAHGVATFSGLSVDQATPAYIVQASSSGAGAPAAGVSSDFSVTAAAATHLVVLTQPTSGVAPTQAFSVTVAAVDQFGNAATSFSGLANITLSSNPGGAGTALSGTPSASFAGAVATFSGLSLNTDANGYKLTINAPGLGTVTTNSFDVTGTPPPPPPPPPPPAPTIFSESVVLNQKLNKKHKPVGKPTLAGYTITFSTAMNQSALANPGNYQVALKVPKTERVKVGRKTVTKKVTVLKPIGFSVTKLTANSVTLSLAGKQTFPNGGQITIIAAPPGGVDSTSDVFLAQNGVLAIGKNGKTISFVS